MHIAEHNLCSYHAPVPEVIAYVKANLLLEACVRGAAGRTAQVSSEWLCSLARLVVAINAGDDLPMHHNADFINFLVDALVARGSERIPVESMSGCATVAMCC